MVGQDLTSFVTTAYPDQQDRAFWKTMSYDNHAYRYRETGDDVRRTEQTNQLYLTVHRKLFGTCRISVPFFNVKLSLLPTFIWER